MSHKALIHSTVDHHGHREYPVWVYDTDRPRNLDKLQTRYAAIRFIDTFSSLEAAERALEREGIPLLD